MLAITCRLGMPVKSALSRGITLLLENPLGASPCAPAYWADMRQTTANRAAKVHNVLFLNVADMASLIGCECHAGSAVPRCLKIRYYLNAMFSGGEQCAALNSPN